MRRVGQASYLENPLCRRIIGFVSEHGFSCAAESTKRSRALAPDGQKNTAEAKAHDSSQLVARLKPCPDTRRLSGGLALLALLILSAPLRAQSPTYGVGRAATPEEIRDWDSSVAPDGTGLPEGSGAASQAQEVYANRCSRCHGSKGQGGDNEALVGGIGSLASPKPLRTVGSYWPYATTVWDYINRAMPFNQPGILTHDQVYQLTALILYWNGIVGENDVMNGKTLPQVKMPNRNGFVPDPRPDVGSMKNNAGKKAAPKAKQPKAE
jgi:S-disulfanyl-L-cysteine oxidoreductase SoxD